jgi:hypothetical protein
MSKGNIDALLCPVMPFAAVKIGNEAGFTGRILLALTYLIIVSGLHSGSVHCFCVCVFKVKVVALAFL